MELCSRKYQLCGDEGFRSRAERLDGGGGGEKKGIIVEDYI